MQLKDQNKRPRVVAANPENRAIKAFRLKEAIRPEWIEASGHAIAEEESIQKTPVVLWKDKYAKRKHGDKGQKG